MMVNQHRSDEGNYGFVERQWEQIREGGWPILKLKLQLFWRRQKYKIFLLPTLPIFIIPVIVMRLIRLRLLIRIRELESEGIGHFSVSLEILLSEMDCGLHKPGRKFVDIWYLNKIVCNKVLAEKWGRIFRIGPRQILKPIDTWNQLIPGGKIHGIPYRHISDPTTPWQACDIHNVLEKTAPHLNFSADEVAIGNEALQKMGFGEHDPIVCFIVRDGAYHNEVRMRWEHRNSSVYLVVPAIEKLTEIGYKAIRMGAKVNEELQISNPSIVDYATNGMRTELLDLFLVSRCRFMVTTGTGLEAVAQLFRRPLAFVNFPQFSYMDLMGNTAIFIPKHFWSIQEKRMLTFPEIFKRGAHLFTLQSQYQRTNIESVDNTPEEITAVVCEMEQRLSGTWVNSHEDEDLQNRFRAIWPQRPAGLPLQARIGTAFLRQHSELLG